MSRPTGISCQSLPATPESNHILVSETCPILFVVHQNDQKGGRGEQLVQKGHEIHRALTDLAMDCQAGAGGMRGKLGKYRELQDNMSEGLRFYMSLQEAISTLRQQCGDYCLTRSIQK